MTDAAPPPIDPLPAAPGGARARLRRAGVLLAVVAAFAAGLWMGLPAQAGPKHENAAATAGEGAGAGSAVGGSEGDGEDGTIWTCSMHPQIRLHEPGKCPICGMTLIPASKADEGSAAPNRVQLSEQAKVLARVRTTAVRRADTSVDLHLLGRLEEDEERIRTVTPWTGGRIDRLYVNSTNETVGRGQTIAKLYSPEIYAAHQDLLTAKRQVADLASGIPVARKAAKVALESARQRLLLLGITDKQLREMEAADKPWRHVKIRSQYGGTVLDLLVAEGAYVKAGTPLFRVANLSKIWVQLDAYESDLAGIALGQTVSLRVTSFPGEEFQGKIAFIDAVVDPKTRTARVRVEVPNKKRRLRPGMFAEAVIHARSGAAREAPLVIPDTAPLFTGKRSVVYVEVPDAEKPTYELREVQLGPRAGDVYPVVHGLAENDRVVVQGAFALDADLQIRGGRSMMTMDDDLSREARKPVKVDARFMKGLSPIVETYLDLQAKLSSDDLEGATRAFGSLAAKAAAFAPASPREAGKVWKKLDAGVVAAARQGKRAKDLAVARRLFAELSRPMIEALVRFGNPVGEPVRLAFCPMASDKKGEHWLQRAEKIENPFFGSQMYTCGEIRETVEAGARLSEHAAHVRDERTGGAPAGHHHH